MQLPSSSGIKVLSLVYKFPPMFFHSCAQPDMLPDGTIIPSFIATHIKGLRHGLQGLMYPTAEPTEEGQGRQCDYSHSFCEDFSLANSSLNQLCREMHPSSSGCVWLLCSQIPWATPTLAFLWILTIPITSQEE